MCPDKAGQVDNLVADSAKYGRWTQHYNGIDVTLNLRVGERFVLVGGTSTGQTVSDNCGVRARLPELATTTTGTSPFGAGLANSAVTPVSPYCHVAYGILTQFSGLSSYMVPKIEVQAVGDVPEQAGRDAGGQLRRAELRRRAVARAQSLRQCAERTVNLIAPGTMYGDAINQLDLRRWQDPAVRPRADRSWRSTSTMR